MMVMHGALDHAELDALALQPHTVLDFSSNVNPFGPPAAVREALAALDPMAYPDRTCYLLRQALAERHGCTSEQVLVGNGSNELIHLIARALLRSDDKALVIEPTFAEYAHASKLAGAKVVIWRACEQQGFAVDVVAIGEIIQQVQPRLVWLCVPNNPTGIVLTQAAMEGLAAVCRAAKSYLVLDRAYAGMERAAAPIAAPAVSQYLIQLYSLTKIYALAGLRLGYMLADVNILASIAPYQPTWSVNSAAQVAGLAALGDRDFIHATLPLLWQSSDQLRTGLQGLGLHVLPSSLPFMLVQTGDGARTRAALLRHGCVVRDCASFGFPQYVRIAPRTQADNQYLLDTWRTLCQHQL